MRLRKVRRKKTVGPLFERPVERELALNDERAGKQYKPRVASLLSELKRELQKDTE